MIVALVVYVRETLVEVHAALVQDGPKKAPPPWGYTQASLNISVEPYATFGRMSLCDGNTADQIDRGVTSMTHCRY